MRIAVVIPTLDEADSIAAAVASAAARVEPAGDAGDRGGSGEGRGGVEVIVADGGSRDRTAERARAAGARVVESPPGRARQLETGWRASEGDVVLFLHADTRLPPGWGAAVRAALADPAVMGGAFRLRFAPRPLSMRVIEWGARARVRLLGLSYGDQALFVRRAALQAIGGVPAVPILEDLDLVRALRRLGRLALLDLPVVTSSRRYLRGGVWRTWWRHVLVLGAWRLGIDRERIAGWYAR